MSQRNFGFGMLFLLVALACRSGEGDPRNDPPLVTADKSATELVVFNGTVLTLDADDTILHRGAVAIVDGAIARVGGQDEVLTTFPDARRMDAQEGIILPGLINAHTHVPMTLFRGIADDSELMD